MQQDKSTFLTEFRKGTVALTAAARAIGVDQATVWRWRQADPAFDAEVSQAQGESDRLRVALVEDSLFSRIIAGKASPAETIFFLVNRSAGRWRHIQTIQHQGPDGGAVSIRVTREATAVLTDA